MQTHTALAVIPILPAVHSLLVVVMLCASGLMAGVWALRHPRAWGVLLRFVWSQKWSLLSLAAFVGLGVAAFGWLTAPRHINDGPPVLADGQWSNRGGDRRHGSVDGSPAPADGAIQWVGGVGFTFFASPAVVGDRVYNVGFQGNRGRLFCWDAHTGHQLWTNALPGFRATFSSPVVDGDRLIVGEGLHHTPDAAVFCVDLRKQHEGDVLWKYPTNSHVECTPVVAHETAFIAAGDDGIYALSLTAEDAGRPAVRWHIPSGRAPDVETALCYHDGRLFVGLGHDGKTPGRGLLVLAAATGAELSRLPMPFPVHGIPAVAGGRMYIGMGNGDYVRSWDTPGQIACLDLASLQTKWTFKTEGTVLGAVVCDDTGLLCGCTAGHVYSLGHAGELLHSWNSHAPILTSPAVAGDSVVIVNQAGVLTALDRHDLRVLWETRLGEPGQYISSPVIAHGHVYVGTPDAGMLCIGTAGGIAEGSSAKLHPLPEKGHVLWLHDIEGQISAAPGVTGSTVVVPVNRADGAFLAGLAHHDSSPPEQRWTLPLDGPVAAPIVTSDEIALVVTANRLLAIDAPTGRILWNVAAVTRSAPTIDGVRVWINVGNAAESRWRPLSLLGGQPSGETTDNAPHPRATNEVELVAEGGRLLLKRADEGSPRLWFDLSDMGDVIAAPIVVDGRAYVAINGGRLLCIGRAEAE